MFAFGQQAKAIKKKHKTFQEKSAPSVANSLSPDKSGYWTSGIAGLGTCPC